MDRPLLFLAIGDVHGNWDAVAEAIEHATLVGKQVPTFVLQVGDAEAIREEADLEGVVTPAKHRSVGNFGALLPGDLACPVYFVGGNHEPYLALDETTGPYPTLWGDTGDVYYLGRVGATTIDNVRVAWISGIDRTGLDKTHRWSPLRERTYFSQDEVAELEATLESFGAVDVLVSHEWPSGLQEDRGSLALRRVIERFRPTLHLCGHLHRSYEGMIASTRVDALTAVPAVTKRQHRERFGWWRLYEKHPDGSITCLRIGA